LLLYLTLPPNKSPTVQPYARDTSVAVGSPIAGFAVTGRPTLYTFDVTSLAAGDYVIDISNPYGRAVIRKRTAGVLIAVEWWELDSQVNLFDAGKVIVDQNYGGPDNLRYVVNGVTVIDASIEAFLYDDYLHGNRDGKYRIATSRQRANGTWAIPMYLDPDVYMFRFFKSEVAGPDVYRVVVSFDPSEIAVEWVASLSSSPSPPILQPVPVVPQQPVAVNQDYGGAGNLTYTINGQAVDGATIQVFWAADYNAGNRSGSYVVAATTQQVNGSWANSLSLVRGHYVLKCFKTGVAGPNTYNLTVE
jgi:hypothetical protein